MNPVFNEIARKAKQTKNKRVRRYLESRLPVLNEPGKMAMIIKGVKTNALVKEFLQDIISLKKPFCKLLMKRNDIVPFEQSGMDSFQFLSQKNECSLFLFGQSLKKRKNSVVFGRLFTYEVTDMIEMSIESYNPIMEFIDQVKTKPQFGGHIFMLFNGDLFESDPKFQAAQSVLLDFFRGQAKDELCLTASSLVMSFFAVPSSIVGGDPHLVMKTYMVANSPQVEEQLKSQLVPPLNLEEVGPSAVFTIQRVYHGSPDLIRESLKTPITHHTRTKNLTESVIPGMKEARVHMQRQDLNQLADTVKKSKALKRAEQLAKQEKMKEEKEKEKEEEGGEDEDEEDEEEDESDSMPRRRPPPVPRGHQDDDEEDDEDEDEEEDGDMFADEEDEEDDEGDEEEDENEDD